MNGTLDIDLDVLLREIARYLAAVDVFRAEECEPTWRPEPNSDGAIRERESVRPAPARSVH